MNKNDINYKAFQYASDKQSLIETLCSDLFSRTKIKVFAYFRFLKNGRYIYLCNRLDWVSFCLQNIQSNQGTALGEEIKHSSINDYYCYLWPITQSDYLMKALYNYNIWNGLSLFRRREDYIELWGFASDRSVDSLSAYYFNHLELLKSFVEDFSTVSMELFLRDSKDNLAIYKEYQIGEEELAINYKMNKERIDQFMKLTEPKKKIAIVTDRGEEYLTKSELFCMNKLMMGLSAKEIARLIPRSYRTIEKHIENMKKKLECRNIHDLKNTYRVGKILPLDYR